MARTVPQSRFDFTSLDIAKWFINVADRSSGDAMTHLKLQKLIYYAQGWALALFEAPLFREDLEAWAHGPVAPTIWSRFRGYGFDALPEQPMTRRIEGDGQRLLQEIEAKYGIYSAKRLERMTHQEMPWIEARGDLSPDEACNNVITKDSMRRFFAGIRNGGHTYR
jgi:uncharacterized phage-associated protein